MGYGLWDMGYGLCVLRRGEGADAAGSATFLRLGDHALEGSAELLRRLERDLDRRAGRRAKVRVDEIDGDRVIEQCVMRMVVGHHGPVQRKPPDLAVARALYLDDFNYGCAHDGSLTEKASQIRRRRYCVAGAASQVLRLRYCVSDTASQILRAHDALSATPHLRR